jgi:hypothetical protein
VRRLVLDAHALQLALHLLRRLLGSARDFYLRLAKFDASPTDPMHLLPMKDLAGC